MKRITITHVPSEWVAYWDKNFLVHNWAWFNEQLQERIVLEVEND